MNNLVRFGALLPKDAAIVSTRILVKSVSHAHAEWQGVALILGYLFLLLPLIQIMLLLLLLLLLLLWWCMLWLLVLLWLIDHRQNPAAARLPHPSHQHTDSRQRMDRRPIDPHGGAPRDGKTHFDALHCISKELHSNRQHYTQCNRVREPSTYLAHCTQHYLAPQPIP